jgi:tetratricopeptide (TPR) repeat protein
VVKARRTIILAQTIPHMPVTHKSRLIPLLVVLCFVTVEGQVTQKTLVDYLRDGLAAQQAGRHEDAIREYSAALKIDPKNFAAQYNIGASYVVLGKLDEALAAFKAALVLRPNEALIHAAIGETYGDMGRTSEAIEALKEALRLNPKIRGCSMARS